MIRLTALGTLSIVVALLLVLALSLAVMPLANAQTMDTTATSSMDATTSPGLPDTGVGGEAAMNLGILLASGLVVIGGVALLARRFA